MKIALGVFGRFHIFDLAKQLSDKNVLNQFFTTYPKFMAESWKIQANKSFYYPWIEALNRAHYKVFKKYFSNVFLRQWFDYQISCNLSPENDIYHCWGSSIKSLMRAQKIGMPVIYDQGSTHILFAQRIRDEEYKISGTSNSSQISKELLNRELAGYEMADFICVPSTFVKNSFLEYGFKHSKIIVNPYGVNMASFNSIPKEDEVFRIIFVGNICIRKGCHYLLQAFNELNLPKAELHMVGPVDSDMHFFLKMYRGSNIKLHGSKPQSELYKYYSQASVFVIMSIEEGLAMVQMQAMACGLPLICSENTGGGDLITNGEEGFVIPVRNVNFLKERIKFLYENEDLRYEMGKKARLKVQNNFRWENYGDRMESIYKNILKR